MNSTTIKYWTAAALLVCFTESIYGQDSENVIKGQVFEADSGAPLTAVNVYLSNTTIGDATDDSGRYLLRNVPPGNYDLVHHFVGYEPVAVNIDIGARDTLVFEVRLKSVPYELDSLVVTGRRDRLWQRNLERFKRHFVGRSNNARDTRILNAEVLDFKIERFGVYSAEAERELHIINEALGYESFVHLEHFEWNYFEDTGQALYYVRMNELEPENDMQLKDWYLKRSVTYDRSIRKFFRGLVEEVRNVGYPDGSNSSGNEFYRFGMVEFEEQEFKLFNGEIKHLPVSEHYTEYIPQNNRYEIFGFRISIFTGENPLMVIPGYGEVSYLDYHDKEASDHIFILDEYGNLLNPLEIIVGGYWSNMRFGDFLPLNYHPEDR